MIFLTTRSGVVEMISDLPDEYNTLVFKPKVLVLSEQVAVATLDAFEDNRLGWGVLAWVSLMQGGQSAEFIARWRAVVEKISDLGIRRTVIDIVCVFAQLTDSADIWKKGLEGIDMNESILMKAQRDKGRAEASLQTRREALLDALDARFSSLPAEVRARVESETDLQQLTTWLRQAVTALDLAVFRTVSGI